MTSSQLVLFTTRRGSFKGQDFKEWMRELIEQCNSQGIIRPTLIIDNAPAHSNVEEITNEYDDIQLLRLAPYSYLLNPIELLWSSFKSYVKQSLRDSIRDLSNVQAANGVSAAEQKMQALEEMARINIQKAATPSNLLNFTNRVERYYSVATRQEPLVELP